MMPLNTVARRKEMCSSSNTMYFKTTRTLRKGKIAGTQVDASQSLNIAQKEFSMSNSIPGFPWRYPSYAFLSAYILHLGTDRNQSSFPAVQYLLSEFTYEPIITSTMCW